MSDEDRLPAKYRVIAQYQLLYAGDDIDAAILAFGQAVSRELLIVNDPEQRVRVREFEHSVLSGQPILEASIRLGDRSRLVAVLYGVTFDEFAKRAPPSVTEAIH